MRLLKKLADTIDRTRRLGNTTALAEMALTSIAVLVTADERHAGSLRRQYTALRVCSLERLESLLGTTAPIVVDNYAIAIAAEEAFRREQELLAEISKQEAKHQGERARWREEHQLHERRFQWELEELNKHIARLEEQLPFPTKEGNGE